METSGKSGERSRGQKRPRPQSTSSPLPSTPEPSSRPRVGKEMMEEAGSLLNGLEDSQGKEGGLDAPIFLQKLRRTQEMLKRNAHLTAEIERLHAKMGKMGEVPDEQADTCAMMIQELHSNITEVVQIFSGLNQEEPRGSAATGGPQPA